MSNKQICNVVLIVLGVLLFAAMFLPMYNFVQSFMGASHTETVSLFSDKIPNFAFKIQKYFNMIGKDGGVTTYLFAKLGMFIGIIGGIALAVFAVLSILKIDLSKLTLIIKIIAIATLAAGAVVLIFGLITIILSKSDDLGPTFYFSGAVGWYFIFICSIASGIMGILSLKN